MSVKNGLIVFRNKKLNNFEAYDKSVAYFASRGVYFDMLSYCAYDDTEEIVRCLNGCKGNYRNVIFLCPAAMECAVKDYTEKLFGGTYDGAGIMQTDETCAFILITDGSGKLTEENVCDFFNEKYGAPLGRAYLKTVGASGAEISAALSKAKELCPGCDFNITEKFSDCTIEMVYPANLSKDGFDAVFRTLLLSLNDHVYAMENVSLAQRLFQLLKLRRMKISVAESFTGGGVAKRLVEIPGISEVFFEGINSYSNESKIIRLGVNPQTIKQFGAVSEETALQMAEGLLKTGDCELAVATTGIAGPNSDSTAKPVGLVYIAVGTEEGVSAFKYELGGNREQITETAINLALFRAYKKIK